MGCGASTEAELPSTYAAPEAADPVVTIVKPKPPPTIPAVKAKSADDSIVVEEVEPDDVPSALAEFRAVAAGIDRFVYLREVQKRSPNTFFRLLTQHTQELMPFVYTPTVGEACQKYHKLPLQTTGLYITKADKGKMLQKLKSWPEQDVRVVVVTDGERILGLGDLGAGGMGISEGKILLYTVIAGVPPKQCLPVCLDLGTNLQSLIDDPEYKGVKAPRPEPAEFDEYLEEFMGALRTWQPHILLQFEDFGNGNAFRLLDNFKERQCCFNDDIQGTACVALAGLLSALRVTGQALHRQRILFLGAGEAGTGIGQLIALGIQKWHGFTEKEALGACFFMDSKGLVCKSREGLQHHKVPFAHDVPMQKDLLSAIKAIKPTILIGVSTQTGAFSQEVVDAMMELNDKPVIFPLSNPTSKSECTYGDAFRWTNGKVVFASGSPFPPLSSGGKTYYPTQANNAYIFPAVGHAASLTKCKSITEEVFLVAAKELAEMTTQEELDKGMLFPSFDNIKDVSLRLMVKCSSYIVKQGLGETPEAAWEMYSKAMMYEA